MSAADGPALLAAAVKAALSARAPRRTVAAVASAVTRALAPTKTAPVTPPTKATPERADEQPAEEKAIAETSPEDLLQALRHARRAERALKKARRRESKVQTPTAPKTTTTADSNAKQELRGAAVGAIEDAAAGEGPPRPPKHTRIDERTPIPIDSGNGQPATASRATSATSQNSTNTEDRELLRQTLAGSRFCLLCQMRRKLKQLHPIHPPWTSRIGVRLPTAELIAQTGAFALRGEASGANSRKEGGEVAPPPGSGESQAQCTIKTQRRGSRWVLALRGVT